MVEDRDHRERKHHGRHKRQGKHEAVDCARAALAAERGHRRLDGAVSFGHAAHELAEGAVHRREVEDAPPFLARAQAREEHDGENERDVAADADFVLVRDGGVGVV